MPQRRDRSRSRRSLEHAPSLRSLIAEHLKGSSGDGLRHFELVGDIGRRHTKVELSEALEVRLSLPFLAELDGEPQHLDRPLRREQLEDAIESLQAINEELEQLRGEVDRETSLVH